MVGGSFKAAELKLDHIAACGFNALQLMPVVEYSGSWGYNPRLLFPTHEVEGSSLFGQSCITTCFTVFVRPSQSNGFHEQIMWVLCGRTLGLSTVDCCRAMGLLMTFGPL